MGLEISGVISSRNVAAFRFGNGFCFKNYKDWLGLAGMNSYADRCPSSLKYAVKSRLLHT